MWDRSAASQAFRTRCPVWATSWATCHCVSVPRGTRAVQVLPQLPSCWSEACCRLSSSARPGPGTRSACTPAPAWHWPPGLQLILLPPASNTSGFFGLGVGRAKPGLGEAHELSQPGGLAHLLSTALVRTERDPHWALTSYVTAARRRAPPPLNASKLGCF